MFGKRTFCPIVTGILCLEKEFLSYCNRNFVFGKRIFVTRILHVCVCVSEFLSQNFCPRILCLEKNFCLITGILCLEKEFFVLLHVTRILCLEKEFLSQNFVCVCVSQNFCPRILCLEKNFCLITGILYLEKEFFVLLYVTGILCLEKEFLSQNFVCVCLRIFVLKFLSQNFCVFGKRTFVFYCNWNFEKESFLHVKSECF